MANILMLLLYNNSESKQLSHKYYYVHLNMTSFVLNN